VDIRGADTTGLAAKRLELENVQPIKEKHGFMENQEAVQAPEGHEHHARKPKPQKGLWDRGSGGHAEEDSLAEDDPQSEEQSEETSPGEQHVLDVRV